ncbi:CBO0543 family protein [Brevibacillus dissolubilis]|uniref:CBO0543 family protein n=1 Tax=Brevibacillus dissolubilis TaxID=1844116 RepID=UPI00111795EF|nr:CBO0543 family protein [Brevibacillus dissolubilis]
MNQGYPSYEQVQQTKEILQNIAYQHWISDEFLSWKWWLLLVLAIVPWFIWWKLVDKKRLPQILIYGMLLAMMAIVLDSIGTELLWWSYPDKLIQTMPPLLPADLTLVPTLFMLVYSFFPTGRGYFNGMLGMSLFSAFVGEPLFIWLDFYRLHEWHLVYSLFFYLSSNAIARWLVDRIYEVSKKAA